MYRCSVVSCSLVAVLFGTFAASLTHADDVEPTADQRKRVAEMFAADIRDAKASREVEDDLAVAARILDTAKAGEMPAGLVIAIVDLALPLALVDMNGRTVAEQLRQLAQERSPIAGRRASDALLEAHRDWLRSASVDDRRTVVASQIRLTADLAEQALADEDLPRAADLFAEAYKLAIRYKDPHRAYLQRRREQTRHQLRTAKAMERDLAKIKEDPDDDAARQRLFDAYLFVLDQPEKAAEHATYEPNPTTRQMAVAAAGDWRELKDTELHALAEWYEAAAERPSANTIALLQRAVRAYDVLLSRKKVDGLIAGVATVNRTKLIGRIEQLKPTPVQRPGFTDGNPRHSSDKEGGGTQADSDARRPAPNPSTRRIGSEYARFYDRIKHLPGREQAKFIEARLNRDNRRRLDFTALMRGKEIDRISLRGEKRLVTIDALYGLTIRDLDLTGCVNLRDLAVLQHVRVTRRLKIDGCSALTSLDGLEHTDIPSISMTNLPNIKGDLKILRTMKQLRKHSSNYIILTGWRSLESLEGIDGLHPPERVILDGCISLRGGLEHLDQTELTALELDNTHGPFDLSKIEKPLQVLSVNNCPWIGEDLSMVGKHTRSLLHASNNPQLKSVAGIQDAEIRILDVSDCPNLVVDFELLPWKHLVSLGVEDVRRIENIDALPADGPLRYLQLRGTNFRYTEELYNRLKHHPSMRQVKTNFEKPDRWLSDHFNDRIREEEAREKEAAEREGAADRP